MSRTRRSVVILGALVVTGFAALVWQRLSLARPTAGSTRPLPLVQAATPLQLEVQRKLLLTADILPIQQADLMAKVAGYLDTISVDRGDRVRAGQVLAVIQQPELEHQVQQARANFDFAKLTYERMRDLSAKDLVAKQELDDASTKLEVAKRLLEVQQEYVKYTKILTPFDGYVTKRYVDPGALIPQATGFVSAVNTVLTVMDLSQVKVLVNVPERDVTSIHVGDPVTLTLDAYADQTFQGRVTKFAPALEASSRTLQVEIDVANDDLALKPGMFARVSVVLERHPQAVVVPAEALLVNELGSFLYVIGGSDGTATVRRTAVRTGIEDGGHVEILAGLSVKDRVVVTGEEFVRDGGSVRVASDAAAPAHTAEH